MSRSIRSGRTGVHGAVLCALVACALAGCGGGDSSSNEPPPVAGAPQPNPPPAPADPPPPVEPPAPPPDDPSPPPPAMGAATVTWTPPTNNMDGSTLTDLAGFRIYYGSSRDKLDQIVEVSNPGLTAYMIENLTPATWYFGVKAYTVDGAESALSNTGSKTIH